MTRKMFDFLAVLILIILIASNVDAGKGAGNAYAFLELGVGARAMGMGGAFVAVANDGTTMYWNPAGLALVMKQNRSRIVDVYSAFGDRPELSRKYYYIGTIFPVSFFKKAQEAMGIGLIRLNIDGIEIWEKIEGTEFGRCTGTFENTEQAIIVSYSNEILKKLFYIGCNLKVIRHDLYQTSANGIGIDIGFLADVSAIFYCKGEPVLGVFDNIMLGMVVHNNFEKKWSTGHIDDGMLSGELGMSVELCIKNRPVGLVSAVLHQKKGRPLYISAGIEIPVFRMMFVRAGINRWYLEGRDSGLDINKLNYGKKLSIGFGWRIGRLYLDYAVSKERFNKTNNKIKHQISTGIRF